MPETPRGQDEAMIKELTRRLREADAMIEHLQSQQIPLQQQTTQQSQELLAALAAESQARLAVQKMEAEIEDLLAPSLLELKNVREQLLQERAVTKHTTDELKLQLDQSGVRETRMVAEMQAVQETLDHERRSYTTSIDLLKNKVEEMAQIMEKTLQRNQVLEEQLSEATHQKDSLQAANTDLKETIQFCTAEADEVQDREVQVQVGRAQSVADMEAIVFSLNRELQESRAGEISLEIQLTAVKESMVRASPAGSPKAASPKQLTPKQSTPNQATPPAQDYVPLPTAAPQLPLLHFPEYVSNTHPYTAPSPKRTDYQNHLPQNPADFKKAAEMPIGHHKQLGPQNDLDELSKKLEALGAVPHHTPGGPSTSVPSSHSATFIASPRPAAAPAFGQPQQAFQSFGQQQPPYGQQQPPYQTQNFGSRFPHLARHL